MFDNNLVNRLIRAWLEIVMNIHAPLLTIFNQQGQRKLLEFQTQGKQIFFSVSLSKKNSFVNFFKFLLTIIKY